MQLQLRNTKNIKPQLQLHYTTTTTAAALHHATSGSCGWGDRPGDHCNHCNHSKKQVQPPFSRSVDSLCHPWFTTTNLPYRFPIFETSATALCGTTGAPIYYISHYARCSHPFSKGNRDIPRDTSKSLKCQATSGESPRPLVVEAMDLRNLRLLDKDKTWQK